MAAAKALEFHAEEAKERQREAGKSTHSSQHKKVQLHAPVHEPIKQEQKFNNQAVAKAGKQFDVSGRSVASAKYILDYGTDEEKKSSGSRQSRHSPKKIDT